MGSTEQHDTAPMQIGSAEELDNKPLVAPNGYRPHRVNVPAVVDDDLTDSEPMPAWRDYLASGSNRSHWFLIGRDREPHIVETTNVDGRYQASGLGYCHQFDNAYDAFWTAETLAKTYTDRRFAPIGVSSNEIP